MLVRVGQTYAGALFINCQQYGLANDLIQTGLECGDTTLVRAPTVIRKSCSLLDVG